MNPASTLETQGRNKATSENPLVLLQKFGQAPWLDYIRRNLITSGELKRLIDEDGLRGMTSNPAIFEKAIAGSTDYADLLEQLHAQGLEVSPTLARNTQATIEEARRLWKSVGRENIMIKVPGTPEGVPAVRQLIGEGININITLLFSQEAYVKVADAYIDGLEALQKTGKDVSKIASVASFFVSRIDALVDSILSARLKTASSPQEEKALRGLLGKVAIANAKQAYKRYSAIFTSERWKALAAQGAQTQRLLWASTSTKNPSYRDVLYIENLIGPDTVNTIPPATMDAFRDHGLVSRTLDAELGAADQTMSELARVGISMQEVTDKLLEEAIKIFDDAFKQLLAAIDLKKAEPAKPKAQSLHNDFPAPLKQAVDATLKDWQTNDKMGRLWKGDKSLWTNDDEDKWLGWLHVSEDQIAHLQQLSDAAADAAKAGFTHALLLGMGGSSLCPEVLQITFGKQAGHPELHVLDSTDPAQIKAVESEIDIAKTLFIVASKSGSTLEPNIFKQYFFDRVQQTVSKENVGQQFIAITDPGSKMQQVAKDDKFRQIFYGLSSIGGRYSALSNFGMVPAAVMGLNLRHFLDRTNEMVKACAATVPAEQNPGAILGAILGTLANLGRNKVTIITSAGLHDLGAWLEQLLAESTGKQGKGLIPVDREQIGNPEVYGNDRIFAYLRLNNAADPTQETQIDALRKVGHPVVSIDIADIHDIGQEFFRWEIATAVAGSILGINAFNQPDVEASKIATRQITEAYEKSGSLPAESPILEEDGIKLFTDAQNAANLKTLAGGQQSLVGLLRAHLNQLSAGDYLALLAFIEMNSAHEESLQVIRHAVRDRKRVATCLGFGPRFLHSTGQAYKGGPNSGVFLQITCDNAIDLPVPGQKYTFGVVKAAQARGDFQVLAERKRRALRVHLPADVKSGLKKLGRAVSEALNK